MLPLLPVGAANGQTCAEEHIAATTDPDHPEVDLYFRYGKPAGADANNPVPVLIHLHAYTYEKMDPCGEQQPGATPQDPFLPELLEAGYGIVSWDSRGHHCYLPGFNPPERCGYSYLSKPEYEYRDLSLLIDWLAAQDWVQKDGNSGIPNDVRVALWGRSLGSLVTAGIDGFDTTDTHGDSRVDVLIPEVVVCDVLAGFVEYGVDKPFWRDFIRVVGSAFVKEPPELDAFLTEWQTSGDLPPAGADYLWDSSPCKHAFDGVAVLDRRTTHRTSTDRQIDKPTLYLHGMLDSLAGLWDKHVLSQGLHGAPFKIFSVNQEHDADFNPVAGWGNDSCDESCEAPCGSKGSAILPWLDRYLLGDTTVDTGATYEIALDDSTCVQPPQIDLAVPFALPGIHPLEVERDSVEIPVTSAAELEALGMSRVLAGLVTLDLVVDNGSGDDEWSLVSSLIVKNAIDPTRDRTVDTQMTGWRLSHVRDTPAVLCEEDCEKVAVSALPHDGIGTSLALDTQTGENEALYLRIEKQRNDPVYADHYEVDPPSHAVSFESVTVALPLPEPGPRIGLFLGSILLGWLSLARSSRRQQP